MWGTKAVQPRLVPNGVPQSYPDAKIPILENPQLFEKLETEALFYAFYYQPGTYQQYLAARELKRQSWRYHKQHRAWFQVCCRLLAAPFHCQQHRHWIHVMATSYYVGLLLPLPCLWNLSLHALTCAS